MSLQEEIEKKAGEIYRDSYQMSIGELMNLYKDEEMDIHPEFQRVFRWSDQQKTKLIESIMLNIPIPPIFVSQSEEGVWDVIDGVQRLSTIFQFVGILKDDNYEKIPPLVLQQTDALPSFDKMTWESDESHCFTKEQQLTFKRARFDVTIIKKESDVNTKYELFQRLNTGGSLLSDQEVRNCIIIMTNKKFYSYLSSLYSYENFNRLIKISDRKTDEQYGMEMITRLLVADKMDTESIGKYNDIAELLDKEIIKICNDKNYDYTSIESRFKKTFDILANKIGEDIFRKYVNGKFTGPFLSSAFLSISLGVYRNMDNINNCHDIGNWLITKIDQMYNEECYVKNTAPGARAVPRFKELTEWCSKYFKYEN